MRIQQSKGLCSFLSEPAAFQLAVGILGCPCSSQVARSWCRLRGDPSVRAVLGNAKGFI